MRCACDEGSAGIAAACPLADGYRELVEMGLLLVRDFGVDAKSLSKVAASTLPLVDLCHPSYFQLYADVPKNINK